MEQQQSILYNNSAGRGHEHEIINQFIMCVDGALVFNTQCTITPI